LALRLMSRMRIRIGQEDFAEAESVEEENQEQENNQTTGEEK
jgi:hypothetical protein